MQKNLMRFSVYAEEFDEVFCLGKRICIISGTQTPKRIPEIRPGGMVRGKGLAGLARAWQGLARLRLGLARAWQGLARLRLGLARDLQAGACILPGYTKSGFKKK